MARQVLSPLKGDPEGRFGVNNQMVGVNKIAFLSGFSLSSLFIGYFLFKLFTSSFHLIFGISRFPLFAPFPSANEVSAVLTFPRLLASLVHHRSIVCLPPFRYLESHGAAAACVREQGAAGSAGPSGDWPGRARVRHHSGGGRLVSAWPKSKEDVCRASPCSPSLPTSLTLTHTSGLSWTCTNIRTRLASLRLWFAVTSLKIIFQIH